MNHAGPPETVRAPRGRGVFWATTSAVAYSASSILGKDLLEDLRPHEMLFWRFTLALVVLWPVLLVRHARGGLDPRDAPWGRLIGLGVAFSGLTTLGFLALDRLDVSLHIVLFYVYPALVAALSPVVGVRVNGRVWAALAVTLAGIALTVPDAFDGEGEVDGLGVMLTLAGASILAVWVLVGSRVVTAASDGLVTMGWSLVGSWLGTGLMALAAGLHRPEGRVVVAELVAFAIVPTIIAGSSFYHALRLLPPALVSMIALLEPVLTVVWAVLLLDERLQAVQVAGGLLVLGGVTWAQKASAI